MAMSCARIQSGMSWETARFLNGTQPGKITSTRLVDELAASGLIRKTRSPADARGIDVTLTATGLARLQAAYPVHLASVRDRVLDHVGRDALPRFGEALAAIARALE